MNFTKKAQNYSFSILILLSLFFSQQYLVSTANAQSKKEIKELKRMRKGKTFPHFFHESRVDLEERESRTVNLYGFQKHDTIASIGAGWGRWEVAFGSMLDSLVFYLEDIDTLKLNKEELQFNKDYYTLLKGSTILSTYFIQIGNENSTLLPKGIFDKVIVINAFHEFSDKDLMIRDIHGILASDGRLILNEFDAFKSGDIPMGCSKRIFTEKEVIEMITTIGFKFVSSDWDIKPINSIPGTKIYVFQKLE